MKRTKSRMHPSMVCTADDKHFGALAPVFRLTIPRDISVLCLPHCSLLTVRTDISVKVYIRGQFLLLLGSPFDDHATQQYVGRGSKPNPQKQLLERKGATLCSNGKALLLLWMKSHALLKGASDYKTLATGRTDNAM